MSVLAGVASATGAVVSASYPTPSIDRWMYVFNQSPGMEPEARVFSPFPYEHGFFDNRDGQFLVAWDTASTQVPAGLALNRYRMKSATVTVRVSGDNFFRFDPTYDSYLTYPPSPPLPNPPGLHADSDVGRPIEMFVCGYRNNYVAGPTAAPGTQVFTQTSPYGVGSVFPSVEKRTVFPGQYNTTGTLIDVSNNVDLGFETRPVAVGQTMSNPLQPAPVAAGELVPLNTDMVFRVDLSQKEAVDALRAGLQNGRVSFMITSLAMTEQASSIVPRFYTRGWTALYGPDPAARVASLDIELCTSGPADWDCDGVYTIDDIFIFLNDWFAGKGDFDADGVNSIDDIFIFIKAWFTP
jgi:hypothetical protein